eukprot:1154374-Pelagomonas_calceolata.AAC.1
MNGAVKDPCLLCGSIPSKPMFPEGMSNKSREQIRVKTRQLAVGIRVKTRQLPAHSPALFLRDTVSRLFQLPSPRPGTGYC